MGWKRSGSCPGSSKTMPGFSESVADPDKPLVIDIPPRFKNLRKLSCQHPAVKPIDKFVRRLGQSSFFKKLQKIQEGLFMSGTVVQRNTERRLAFNQQLLHVSIHDGGKNRFLCAKVFIEFPRRLKIVIKDKPQYVGLDEVLCAPRS